MKSLNKYKRIVVFDFETSGVSYKKDKIIEFGCMIFNNDGQLIDTHEQFVNPGIPITNSDIHGITDEMVKDGISYDALTAILRTIFYEDKDSLYIAYNLGFDMSFVIDILGLHDSEFNVLDPLSIHRDRNKYDGALKPNSDKKYGHTLESLVKRYNVEVENTHRALDDVKATIIGLQKLGLERDDLIEYVNRIGFNQKWGYNGIKIKNVQYISQTLYGTLNIINYTNDKKDYSGPKDCVLKTIDINGDIRYFVQHDRIDALKDVAFSKGLFKIMNEQEAKDKLRFVREQYNASKDKGKIHRAKNLKVLKLTMEEL